MKCPYLRKKPQKCIRMIEKGHDGKLSDFDIQHFCNGNPIYCYFYRLPQSKKK